MNKQPKESSKTLSGDETILEILSRAADDRKFLARLVENPQKVLREYNLTSEERTALVRGDVVKIESWTGQLDERLRTWFKVRMTQERW
jgi:hypothetical protein